MKTIIAGTRTFDDYDMLRTVCLNYQITEVVSGGAKGADALGERYARDERLPLKKFLADWTKHGRAAGPIRNRKMADYAEQLIALWDRQSRGTRNMIEVAAEKGLRVVVFDYVRGLYLPTDGSKR